MAKELIRLENLVKVYDDKTILKSINLYINDREFLTLLGPSGCGKTTTLRLIGGFETPTSGVVYFDGVNVNQVPPHRRQVNTVFQKYALFPHLNVFDNIAFGLRIPRRDRTERQQEKLSESQIRQRVLDTLKLVGLQGYEHRSVTRLSGGEQQRVAIARAVAVRPKVLLLDEPLGALDLKLRKEMQTELKHFQQQLGITFIYVTHDQEEALTMSDTIVVMNRGKIQQVGRPTDIYNEPKNAFVADFIGESNILDGVMCQDRVAEFAGRIFPCVDEGFAPDEPVDVVLRPEDLQLVDTERAQMSGTVESVVFKGVHYEMMVRTDAFTYMVHSTQYRQVGDQVGLYVQPSDIHIMHKPRQEDEKEETPV